MSEALAIVRHPWLVAVGWTVILSLWSTTLVALVLSAWRLLRPRASAPAQYRAAVTALVTIVVLALLAPALLFAVSVADAAQTVPAAPTVAEAGSPSGTPQLVGGPVVPAQSWATDPVGATFPRLSPAAMGFLGGAWMLGAVAMLTRLAGGWVAANRLRRRATLIDEGPVRQIFERLSEHAQVGPVALVVSSELDAPVAVGVRAPAVVVPAHLLDCVPPDSLAPILAHELAHVARQDYTQHLVLSAVEALLFQSPAMWWVGRRIREAREFCCDDISVDAVGNRTRYVEALTLIARLGTMTTTRPAVGMAGPRLITRVRRLLEGEPAMSMPLVRTVVAGVATVALVAASPTLFTAGARQLSTHVVAAGQTQQGARVPLGHPQRQEGSGIRIVHASSTDTHVCGTFEVQNVANVAVTQVRFVGILSFAPGANRSVQIVESDWLNETIAPGATATLTPLLVELDAARREAQGQHVQAFCAVRALVYENGAAWSVTPNPAATRDVEALGKRWRTLPRSLVGQTRAASFRRVTLCLDEAGAEYSPGAQIAVRDEPGSAARCTREGQWIEVDRHTGKPVASGGQTEALVALEINIEGVPSTMAVTSAVGAVATVRAPGGHTWGFVPHITADGGVEVALHDMSSTPHRLVGTRTLQPGLLASFEEVDPAVSVRLASR